MMIDNSESNDNVIIDNLFVELEDVSFYGIDRFCIIYSNKTGAKYNETWTPNEVIYVSYDTECPASSNNHIYSEVLCIGNKSDNCGPAKVMLDLDISSPNEYINDGLLMDATNVQISESCIQSPASSTDLEPTTPNYMLMHYNKTYKHHN